MGAGRWHMGVANLNAQLAPTPSLPQRGRENMQHPALMRAP